MIRDAILLTGGKGTRTAPFNAFISKHLLNVGGKPIIDYPLNTLKRMGIENLTIVVGSSFSGQIMDYIQDGSKYGMRTNFIYQSHPLGIGHAINLAKPFVKDKFITLLGDNWFQNPIKFNDLDGAQIALTIHPDVHRFGVAICSYTNNNIQIEKLEEKPKTIDHRYMYYVITGCYLFDQNYFEYFKNLKPSSRNEYEIIEILQQYHKDGKLNSTLINSQWSDLGSHESIAFVNNQLYVKNISPRKE